MMKLPHSEHWALPGVSQAPYLSIPLTVCILATTVTGGDSTSLPLPWMS